MGFSPLLLGLCATAQLGAVASDSWWSLALWTPRVDPSTHPLLLCSTSPGLSPTQRQICQKQPHFMKLVAEGVQLAIAEYRHQFQAKRSNWTTENGLVPIPRSGKEIVSPGQSQCRASPGKAGFPSTFSYTRTTFLHGPIVGF
ncbi:proto-oncogene Wnt-3-like [Lethenteron reissneri]|uniref:proto-oncogene Wnt-3-like n=1 Tax=Lethenteron reissneri TaxID=7753 RepID=UPI002AB6C2F8|nr:proto-oncogene Wnt-3-like [Lethenteron reissneri]